MLIQRQGPLLLPQRFPETKDPCPVFDGKLWHIYGSGGDSATQRWLIYHATAPTSDGPWHEEEPAIVAIQGRTVAAPGIVYDPDEQLFHMFVQTDCFGLGGTIEHLISSDGQRFNNFGTVLYSVPGTNEAGIYDSHPAIIHTKEGKKELYLSYTGFPDIPHISKRGDIYLLKSTGNSWYGPWERQGVILTQEDVNHHNQKHDDSYEWGLEGSQLIQLPNGKILMNAVCFLPAGEFSTKQRVFFAIADDVKGPYKTLGPVLAPVDSSWESGENGHAAGFIEENNLHLFYQAREKNGPWRYGRAIFDVDQLSTASVTQ